MLTTLPPSARVPQDGLVLNTLPEITGSPLKFLRCLTITAGLGKRAVWVVEAIIAVADAADARSAD